MIDLEWPKNIADKTLLICAVLWHCQQWCDIKGRVGVFELKVIKCTEVSLEMPHESRCMHMLSHNACEGPIL